jgi:hypothetical protein
MMLDALSGCQSPDGPQKYPVRGVVEINGSPAQQVAVTFHHERADTPGNLRYPSAVTDANGAFVLSSEGDRDGAVEGNYKVTFAWMSSPDLDAFDMLGGKFSKPESSLFTAQVPVEAGDLPPFQLVVPESEIRLSGRPRPSP